MKKKRTKSAAVERIGNLRHGEGRGGREKGVTTHTRVCFEQSNNDNGFLFENVGDEGDEEDVRRRENERAAARENAAGEDMKI